MPFSLAKTLRSIPEMEHFSPQQQADLLKSFNVPSLWRKAIRTAAFQGAVVSVAGGGAATAMLPKHVSLIIIACLMLVVFPVAYIIFLRQVRDEFRLLLIFLLTGATLPVCPRCGYDLTGTEGPQCPECGADVKWKPASYTSEGPT